MDPFTLVSVGRQMKSGKFCPTAGLFFRRHVDGAVGREVTSPVGFFLPLFLFPYQRKRSCGNGDNVATLQAYPTVPRVFYYIFYERN
uniref:Uncharacterized protein n=1 Tax=Rhizophora mucronata TaxID=61149 RepID=A0A2P2N770_RHIMU